MFAKSLQSCSTLGSPMDCSLPGSSLHGIPQARILEWAAMPFPTYLKKVTSILSIWKISLSQDAGPFWDFWVLEVF